MHEVRAKGLLSAENGMNLYRGCTHGCIYCDARSACYQMKHDFEDVEVKINAPELLYQQLRRKRKKCVVVTGAMSDPYLHAEKQMQLTRRCLEIIDRLGFGAAVQTKSDLVLRDLDLFKRIHAKAKCVVQMTLTTADSKLCRIVEPNVCDTRRRAEALNIFHDEGIPTIVWLTPILPFLNDTMENIDALLEMCVEAKVKGVVVFDDVGLTLRDGNREYFYSQLDRYFPGMKKRYAEAYGNAYFLPSPNRAALMRRIREVCGQNDILCDPQQIFSYIGAWEDRLGGVQLGMFDETSMQMFPENFDA